MGVDGMFAKGAIPVLEKALSFYEQRNTLLAQNVANASTPGYQPVDLDEGEFQSLLAKAVKERDDRHPRSFQMSSSDHIAVREDGSLEARALPVREGQVRHDGNPFNAEREMSRLADNTIAYQRTAQLLATSYHLIQMAIQGRAS